jgi:hypothetical protein
MRLTRLLAFGAAMMLSANCAFAAQDDAYLAELVAKSRQLHLAERPEWLKLVHYQPNFVAPGVHGLVDSPGFYNAPDGKTNPQAELEATLASFYSDVEEGNTRQNPQCMFIARYTWLKEQLAFDPKRLPQRECKRYKHWHDSLNPGGLTVVYASAYLNSPSSMYGHPLLRVDAKDQDEHTRLLAYSISFAANTNETNGLAFAFNGLFGGYPGEFSILPYYVKVREYSNLENRDIWEYSLSFTPEEIDRILMHAWELGPNYFEYYFFDENCAYHLLGLLQVARPDMDLTSPFRWWSIPTDSVRAVAAQPGLVKSVVYRPSSATIARFRLARLDDHERTLVKDLSVGRISAADAALTALPVERKAAVLEAGQEYTGYRRATGKTDVADPAELSRELLAARSRLDVAEQAPPVPMPEVHPDQGHASSRVALGAGRTGIQNFQEASVRATYHDLLDDDRGFARGAEVEFFSLKLRHYDFGANIPPGTRVENFTPINILSLSPRDDFFSAMSWKIALGWQRVRAPNGSDPLAFGLEGGAGASWSNPGNTALWYCFVDNSVRVSGAMRNGYALGLGASAGVLYDATPRWRLHPYVRGLRYFLGQVDTPWSYGLEQRVTLGRDLALRLDLARNRELNWTYNSGMASVLYYF